MILSCWNIRGLNQPQKQREIVSLIHNFKLDVVGIVETKVRMLNQDRIHSNMLPHWCFVTNSTAVSTGRIWVGWNPNKIKLSVLLNTSQMIHVKIETLDNSVAFVASFIYGLHTIQDRRPLWRDINHIAEVTGSLPWLSLGDFNTVLHSNDIYGSNLGRDRGAVDFNDCVNASCLVDLRYTGCLFSWNNRRTDSAAFLVKKLDRALVNPGWLNRYPTAYADFLPSGISDHSPIIIHVVNPVRKKGVPFKFFNYWTSLDQFHTLVHDSWSRPVEGNFQFQLCHKLRSLKVGLKSFSFNLKGKERLITDKAREDLLHCQSAIDAHPSSNSSLRDLEKHLMTVFLEALRIEEEIARQKSRIQWLDAGDRNTAYFHNSIKNRRNRNRIVSLIQPNGTKTTTEEEAKFETIRYFKMMLGTPSTNPYPGINNLSNIIQKRIPNDQFEFLDSIPSNEEIKNTVFSLHSNKAPGPDGFNAHFFKETWSVTGSLVTQAIREFFITGEILAESNATLIALIPKVPNPSSIGEFRPISCCNTIYKCISKIIATRLQVLLPDFVDKAQ